MKVLIVNNDNEGPTELLQAFPGSGAVSWDNLNGVGVSKFNLVVLSGVGNDHFPIVGHEMDLQKEFDLIRSHPLPILGICYGFELIIVTFGGTLVRLPAEEKGIRDLELLGHDKVFAGIDTLRVYEGHRWVARTVANPLVPLARSQHGIEAVKHKTLPIYGFQFHPEKHLDKTVGTIILRNFKAIVSSISA